VPPELPEVQEFILDQLRSARKPQAVEALAWRWHNRSRDHRERPPSRAVLAEIQRAVEALAVSGLVRSGMVDVVTSRRASRTVQHLACWLADPDAQETPP
jgi:hypothetical protein